MNFIEKLTNIARKNKSLLCVGLDPDPQLMPGNISVFEFNRAIIEATAPPKVNRIQFDTSTDLVILLIH